MQITKPPSNRININQPVKHYRLRQVILAILILSLIILASFLTLPLTGNIVPETDLGAVLGLASLLFAGVVAWKASEELMK